MSQPIVVGDEQRFHLNDTFMKMITRLTNPQVILIIGVSRIGKSNTLNQIIKGLKSVLTFRCEKPFKTGVSPNAVTKGCDAFISIKLHDLLRSFNLSTDNCDDADLIFVDTEGFESLDGSTMFLVPGILTFLQIATLTIYFNRGSPTTQTLQQIEKNQILTNSLKIIAQIQSSEKIVYGAQYNFGENYNDDDPLQFKIHQINEERQQFQEALENRLHTKTIIGPFKNEKNPNQDDPILHVYWDSLKDIVLSIKESVVKRGKQEPISIINTIKTPTSLKNMEIT